MPRTARASVGVLLYHALHRGNRRDAVFHKDGDYAAFVEAMVDARDRLPVDVLRCWNGDAVRINNCN